MRRKGKTLVVPFPEISPVDREVPKALGFIFVC